MADHLSFPSPHLSSVLFLWSCTTFSGRWEPFLAREEGRVAEATQLVSLKSQVSAPSFINWYPNFSTLHISYS